MPFQEVKRDPAVAAAQLHEGMHLSSGERDTYPAAPDQLRRIVPEIANFYRDSFAGVYLEQYGLLQLPGRYYGDTAKRLLASHQAIASCLGSSSSDTHYWAFTEDRASTSAVLQVMCGELRLRVCRLSEISSVEMAAFIHTQLACYEAKNTMGSFSSTRKSEMEHGELQADYHDESAVANEAWLIANMTEGWNPDDMVVILDLPSENDEAFTPLAGGVVRFGNSAETLTQVGDSSILPTMAALSLRHDLLDDLAIEALELREQNVANIGRLFSIGSIDKVRERLGDDISKYHYEMLLLLVLYGLTYYVEYSEQELEKPAMAVIADTHLSALYNRLNSLFGLVPIAPRGNEFHISKAVKNTPHFYHYDYWNRVSDQINADLVRIFAIYSSHIAKGIDGKGGRQLIQSLIERISKYQLDQSGDLIDEST